MSGAGGGEEEPLGALPLTTSPGLRPWTLRIGSDMNMAEQTAGQITAERERRRTWPLIWLPDDVNPADCDWQPIADYRSVGTPAPASGPRQAQGRSRHSSRMSGPRQRRLRTKRKPKSLPNIMAENESTRWKA